MPTHRLTVSLFQLFALDGRRRCLWYTLPPLRPRLLGCRRGRWMGVLYPQCAENKLALQQLNSKSGIHPFGARLGT